MYLKNTPGYEAVHTFFHDLIVVNADYFRDVRKMELFHRIKGFLVFPTRNQLNVSMIFSPELIHLQHPQ